ncbi:hypothetical protein ABL78_6207 [Leptomonas seymouri]|uniref:Clp1 P-loop domain-containing protein n=1 Tax=Leptomonas seymouri TaxID=5684 RepID=A0A0N1IIH1_LEPSE|nr:hypothetical protein ABL78_6207 [Leptomonas seymouri]|eukprot:KPI84740.1 hypothetical protein ABL78_6207 [Leptomonas seymouri]
MPVNRGKRIVDARPQAAEVGVGSLPLTSTSTGQRGARRVAASGVEYVGTVDTAPTTSALSASAAPPLHFKVPAAVLQRIQEQHHHQPLADVAVTSMPSATSNSGDAPERVPTASAPQPAAVTPADEALHLRPSPSLPILPTETDSHAAQQMQPAAASKTSAKGGAVAVEEVSEVDISATVAALKAVSSSHLEASTATATTSPGERATSKSKPVIFSRQWRRQIFASWGTAHASRPLSSGERQSGGREGSADSTSNSADEEAEDDDGFASPFGGASVIRFDKTGDEACPFGGLHGVAAMLSSSSSSSSSNSDSGDGSAVHVNDDEGSSQRPSRRARHARHQLALEARQKQRVQRHMSGFDKEFLRQQEAQLLHEPEEEEEEEEGSDSDASSGEDFTADSNVESADGCEAAETSSQDRNESAPDEREEGQAVEGRSLASCERQGGSGGFGAMKRARQQEAEARQVRDELQRRRSGNDGTGCVPLPVPQVGGASSVPAHACSERMPPNTGARSHWFDAFFFAVHENRLRKGGCHHTLMGLRDAVAIHGPCGIIGFGLGEVCVSGFYLGKKQMNLWHEEHHAVLMPMKKLKTRHAQDMGLPQWTHVPDPVWPAHPMQPPTSPTAAKSGFDKKRGSSGDKMEFVLGQPLNACHFVATSQQQHQSAATNAAADERDAADDEEGFLQSLQWNCEAVFGEIDWDWVEATVQSWRSLFSNKLPPILLVVQPSSSIAGPRGAAGPMRKYYFARKRGRGGQHKAKRHSGHSTGGAYMDLPSFVAHRSETTIDLALLPGVVPSIAAQGCGCVMVLGSANIGKSTLCRFLANVLLSQHGLCYWLDLDVGQPEFGVPGQFTLVMVRRPLLRERDSSCVRTVASLFIGANTAVQCPVSTANALATICAQVAAVAKDHPVVVNTHGWVLQTGRRVSVEALRRLRPRQVIHLYKGKEEAWAQDTAALLDPRNGLNADVVQRRFLVRRSAPKIGGGDEGHTAFPAVSPAFASPLSRLPFPHAFEVPSEAVLSSAESPVSSPNAPGTSSNYNKRKATSKGAGDPSHTWRGQVHAVRVEREETYSSIQLLKATKGSRGRQQRWQTYFAPLLRFYTHRSAGAAAERSSEAETTLLEAPLSSLRSIVLAERDEKMGDTQLFPSDATSTCAGSAEARQMHAEVAAALEHAVVAVLFHKPCETVASLPSPQRSGGCVVRSLASLPCGFPVTCYGVVESSEQELLSGREAAAAAIENGAGDGTLKDESPAHGWIRLRVPLRPAVVAAMLRASDASPATEMRSAGKPDTAAVSAALGTTQISIAYSAVLRQDTSFVDV